MVVRVGSRFSWVLLYREEGELLTFSSDQAARRMVVIHSFNAHSP